VQEGPASNWVKSTTLMPFKAGGMSVLVSVLVISFMAVSSRLSAFSIFRCLPPQLGQPVILPKAIAHSNRGISIKMISLLLVQFIILYII